MDTIQDILIHQTQMMRNSSLGPYVPADFSPSEHIVVVNALFYASLGITILAAFVAMLIKSWVREFDRGLRGMSIPEQRAKTREFRYLGMEYWRLLEMVAILPLLIQISLLLFAIGLVVFLFDISKPSFWVTTAIFGVGILFYAITTSISIFVTSSPFRSPLSHTLSKVYQHIHSYFCPSIDDFLSDNMDTTPATALGRLRRDIQVILLKSRPYPENDFVEPIGAVTVDEVQLSTAASALRRIHDSAPNSQHSEALQWSVWQVAGSATLRVPPPFDLPSWILDRWGDKEQVSNMPPALVVALMAVSLRSQNKTVATRHRAILSAVRQHVDIPKAPWAQLVIGVFDRLLLDYWGPRRVAESMIQMQSNDLINMIRKKKLHREESLWLLSTLSDLRSEGRLWRWEPFLIGICLAVLLDDAQKWGYLNPPDVVLLEAVVTLATISCSPNRANRLSTPTNSRENPWLLLNLRNPNLISACLEGTPLDHHKQLISLLFLVVYALERRGSLLLAAQYFTIITAKGDFPLYTSALTAIAPAIENDILSMISTILVVPRTQDLPSMIGAFRSFGRKPFQEELLQNYDHQLEASTKNPDPNIFAILLMVSKDLPSHAISRLQNLNRKLKNPWLRLAIRVVAQLDIPDEYDVPMESFHDHRVHNMIAAVSLRRYTEGKVTQFTESLLLATFLESRELAVSSVALEYYTKSTISYSYPWHHLATSPQPYLLRSTSRCRIINCGRGGQY